MQNTFETNFTDSEGHEWNCRITMGLALKFCRVNKIKLEMLSYENLDSYQLVELCFNSIQHHTDAKNYTLDDFMENLLNGEAYNDAIKAVMYALVNFTLPRLPEAERVKVIKEMKEEQEESN